MTISPSATTAGKSEGAGPRASAPRPGGATLRQRKTVATGKSGGGGGASRVASNAGNAGMWRFYTEDSPGLKVYVLILYLIYLARV